MRKSDQKHSSSRQALQQSDYDLDRSTAHQIRCIDSFKIDQNRSAQFAAPNFPDLKSQAPQEHSIINLGEQSVEGEESYQTFKPSTTCPNDRYSL